MLALELLLPIAVDPQALAGFWLRSQVLGSANTHTHLDRKKVGSTALFYLLMQASSLFLA